MSNTNIIETLREPFDLNNNFYIHHYDLEKLNYIVVDLSICLKDTDLKLDSKYKIEKSKNNIVYSNPNVSESIEFDEYEFFVHIVNKNGKEPNIEDILKFILIDDYWHINSISRIRQLYGKEV